MRNHCRLRISPAFRSGGFPLHARRSSFLTCLLLLLAPTILLAQTATNPPASTNLTIRQISEGVYQVGSVRLDKTKRTIQFPAQLNMNHGPIEYLIVASSGKTHESLLRTDTEPQDLQVALLLLGAKGAPSNEALLRAPTTPFHVNSADPAHDPLKGLITGDSITIELSWSGTNGEQRVRGEDCVRNLDTMKPTERGPWIYNGSRVIDGKFLAQRDGSIVALVDDLDAMVNNPRAGHENDQNWEIITNGLPPLKSPVQVTFQLSPRTNP